MTFQVVLNWKSFAALGATALALLLARNLTPEQSEKVLTTRVNASKLIDVSDDED